MTSVPRHNNPNNTILFVDSRLRNLRQNTCRASKKVIPNLKPYINNLSQNSSLFNSYAQIYVYGENFFPYGQTTVNFGSIENIPIQFLNSNSFFFELQNFAFPGVYNITVNNNLNMSPLNTTANSVGVVSLRSNILKYTITS